MEPMIILKLIAGKYLNYIITNSQIFDKYFMFSSLHVYRENEDIPNEVWLNSSVIGYCFILITHFETIT